MFGLKINISRTELLYQPPPMSIELPETITVHDEPLKTTESFTYLGSTVRNQLCRSGSGKKDPICHEGAAKETLELS